MKFKIHIFGLLLSVGLFFSLPAFAISTFTPTTIPTAETEITFFLEVGEQYLACAPYALNTCGIFSFTEVDNGTWQWLAYIGEPEFIAGTYHLLLVAVGAYDCYTTMEICKASPNYLGQDIVLIVGVAGGGNIITIPADFSTGFLAFAGTLFTDLLPLILIVIGLPLAFWVVGKIIKLTNLF